MAISISETKLNEIKIIEPKVFGDARGFFMESWNKRDFSQITDIIFVQDNQ